MWKAALFLILLFVAGHFAVRYLRTNPLNPVVESNEVVVETREYEVRLARDGPVEGTYLLVAAESVDWSGEPANATLSVIGFAEVRDYLRAYPDFHRYGPMPGLQLDKAASTLSAIAANRLAYGELRGLIELVEERVDEHGERICITISGESLRVNGAASLDDGSDHTSLFANREEEKHLVFVNELIVEDCAVVAASR